jgi:hypothetical protein
MSSQRLFRRMIRQREGPRSMTYHALVALGEPGTILDTAVEDHRAWGDDTRLAMAASLLAEIGAMSLPAIRGLIESDAPESGHLTWVVVAMRRITTADRLSLLVRLSMNPSEEVRETLLEGLEELEEDDLAQFIGLLGRENDSEALERARELLK